jgi:hypothetical protein
MKLIKIIMVMLLMVSVSQFAGASVKDINSVSSFLQVKLPPPPPHHPPRPKVVVHRRTVVVRRKAAPKRKPVHIKLPHVKLPPHPRTPPPPPKL